MQLIQREETTAEKVQRLTRYVRQMRRQYPKYETRKLAQDAIENLILDTLEG